MLKYIFISFIVFIYISLDVSAQDARFSQYDISPIIFSPANTGMYRNGDIRAVAQFRSQWGALNSSLTTTAFAVDLPFNKRWGYGAYIMNSDEAKTFNAFTFIASGAYQITQTNQKKHKLTVGLQTGFSFKSLRESELIYDNQYINGNFDPDMPTGETFDKASIFIPEVNIGFNYASIYKRQKINPFAGLAVFHCTNPKESFYGSTDSRLPLRYNFYGGTRIKIIDEFILSPRILVMRQTNAMEINAGLSGDYTFERNKITITGGTFFRAKDAIIIIAGINYKNFIYRLSYDINFSSLRTYSHSRGGLEFSLILINRKRFSSKNPLLDF